MAIAPAPLHFTKHISISESNQTAVDVLAEQTPLSKQKIKQVMLKGAVWLTEGKKTQRIRRAKRFVKIGQTLHIYYDQTLMEREITPPELIADFGGYSVWNKPYGLLSQGSKWGDHFTVSRFAEQNLKPERNAFIVHRLDRAANGLILIAHSKQMAAKLSALFQQRDVDKRYRIWVEGEFPDSAKASTPVRVENELDGRHAASQFVRLEFDAERNRSLLDVNIETGRKHQIRRHAMSLGFPVVGDRLYGSENTKENLQLTAYYLAFQCPASKDSNAFRQFNLLTDDRFPKTF